MFLQYFNWGQHCLVRHRYIVSVQMVGNITCNAHVAKKIQDRESQHLIGQDGSTVAMDVYSYR